MTRSTLDAAGVGAAMGDNGYGGDRRRGGRPADTTFIPKKIIKLVHTTPAVPTPAPPPALAFVARCRTSIATATNNNTTATQCNN